VGEIKKKAEQIAELLPIERIRSNIAAFICTNQQQKVF